MAGAYRNKKAAEIRHKLGTVITGRRLGALLIYKGGNFFANKLDGFQ